MNIMKLAAVALLGLTASQPGFARVSSNTAAAPAKAASAPSSSATAASAKKYCITEEALTGSRIPTTSCRTKAEWLAEGVEVKSKN